MDSNHIPVVCCADDKYSMPLATTVCSILHNLSSAAKLDLFVIDGGISNENKNKIERSVDLSKCEINWLNADHYKLNSLKTSGHISISSYLRILAPGLLPEKIDKFIYLDCDLIVNANLEELWKVELGDKPIFAVQEFRFPYFETAILNHQQLGISPNSKYFNAGVLLIDAEKWRKEEITDQVINYLTLNNEFVRFHDQDGLNVIFANRWGELDPRWNQTPFTEDFGSWKDSPFDEETYKRLLEDPYIIHFATKFKPWNHYSNHNKKIFYKYLDMTAWAGWRYGIDKAILKQFGKILKGSE